MSFDYMPVVGQWYRRLDRPQPFQVVAVDEGEETIDIEYFDGTVDEWPFSHWQALDIETADAPQDWTGAFDELQPDDLNATDTGTSPADWRAPLEGEAGVVERPQLAEELRAAPPHVAARRRAKGSRAGR